MQWKAFLVDSLSVSSESIWLRAFSESGFKGKMKEGAARWCDISCNYSRDYRASLNITLLMFWKDQTEIKPIPESDLVVVGVHELWPVMTSPTERQMHLCTFQEARPMHQRGGINNISHSAPVFTVSLRAFHPLSLLYFTMQWWAMGLCTEGSVRAGDCLDNVGVRHAARLE